MKLISISLAKRTISKKFPEYTLDAYALKVYNTLYQESKTKVNQDIKKLSIDYKTVVPKNITMLIFAEMLPSNKRKEYLDIHLKEITQFD